MAINRIQKLVIILLSVVLLAVIIFFSARLFLYHYIQKTIDEKLAELKEKGIDIRYDYVQVDSWKGKLEAYQVKLILGTDSSWHPFEANVPHVLIKGIDLWEVLLNKRLSVKTVALAHPSITWFKNSSLLKRDTAENTKPLVGQFVADRINASQLLVLVKDSLSNDTLTLVHADVGIDRFDFNSADEQFDLKKTVMDITNLSVRFPKSLYAFSARQVQMDFPEKTLHIDSMNITPTRSRKAFMKYFNKESDYVSGKVPYLKIKGLDFFPADEETRQKETRSLKNITFLKEVKKIELAFMLEVYRDKRYPFRKKRRSALPAHFVQRLPWTFKADSIQINNSYLSYEEFPANGNAPGMVYFDKLNATISYAHNQPVIKKNITMKTTSRFMGKGDLTANFMFPSDTTKPYSVKGSLKNFPLQRINRMLVPAANMKVEKGTMNNLEFNFLYNMYRSDGTVAMHYQDLNLSTLKDNAGKGQSVDVLKSLLLNTFVIKKNTNAHGKDIETGTVLFYRDTKRSVFNYWWKSILSGITSSLETNSKSPIFSLQPRTQRSKGKDKK